MQYFPKGRQSIPELKGPVLLRLFPPSTRDSVHPIFTTLVAYSNCYWGLGKFGSLSVSSELCLRQTMKYCFSGLPVEICRDTASYYCT